MAKRVTFPPQRAAQKLMIMKPTYSLCLTTLYQGVSQFLCLRTSCPSSILDKPSLLDPGGIDDRTSDALTISTSRAGFRRRISERDGTCVMTGSPDEYCEASHIIPHAKGDQVRSEMLTCIATSLSSSDQVHVLFCQSSWWRGK